MLARTKNEITNKKFNNTLDNDAAREKNMIGYSLPLRDISGMSYAYKWQRVFKYMFAKSV